MQGERMKVLKVLHKETGWVIWRKANPKNKGETAFWEHNQCIRCKESDATRRSHQRTRGGSPVTVDRIY
jgi:hypothetical protein